MSRTPKQVMRHESHCFICGLGQSKRYKKGRRECQDAEVNDGGAEDEQMPHAVDVLCDNCPKAFHEACLPEGSVAPSGRYSCGWHKCNVCGRSASASGGILLHCLECPSALCYDCFPPNFRRVQPVDKFFASLNKRGWDITPQKFVVF